MRVIQVSPGIQAVNQDWICLVGTATQRVQVVQQRPDSWPCSVSGHVSGKHTTPLQFAGPLALAPIPPERSLVHERSSGALTASLQQMAQQVPASAAVLISNGGMHWTFGHSVPAHGSRCWVCKAPAEARSVMAN